MINSSYTVLLCKDIEKEASFFRKAFGFEETFVSDWYISLKEANGYELAIMDYKHETIPELYRVECRGIILNFEVDNVEKIYEKIQGDLRDILVMDIKIEEFGQKHFIIKSPNNTLVDIIEIIPPSEEFAKQYMDV